MWTSQRMVKGLLLALAMLGATLPAAAVTIDHGVYTNYYMNNTEVNFTTCSNAPDYYCQGAGFLGPFGRAGCVIEGTPTYYNNVVQRAVYVVDLKALYGNTGVNLYRYLKTDTIDAATGADSVTYERTNLIDLPLVGSEGGTCFIAGNENFLYIGTDQTSAVLQVKKGALTITTVISASSDYKIHSITADVHGYIAVNDIGSGSTPDPLWIFTPSGEKFNNTNTGISFLLTPYNGVSNVTSTSP